MITPAFNLTATERVLPKLALDFTTASLDSRVTFTRSGNTATVVNSSGLVATINADLPRFDYDPTTLACKGLLIEEPRTNICLQSQDFSTTWVNNQSSELTDVVVSPDGTQNADKLVEDTNAGTHQIRQVVTTTAVATTFSVYVKPAERSWVMLALSDSGNTVRQTYFDVGTGAVGTVASNTTASITAAGNGWYRCVIAISAAFAGSNSARIYTATGDGGVSYTGDGTSGIYIWGAQLEVGAFATSYIPTTTTALTRNADVATMTGTNFSDWFNASEGAFVVQAGTFPIGAIRFIYDVSDTTNNEEIRLGTNSSGASPAFVVIDGGVTQASMSAASSAGAAFTACSAYKLDSFVTASNGLLGTPDTSGTLPSVSQLNFGSRNNGTLYFNGCIQKFSYYPQRLTNAEVQAFSKG